MSAAMSMSTNFFCLDTLQGLRDADRMEIQKKCDGLTNGRTDRLTRVGAICLRFLLLLRYAGSPPGDKLLLAPRVNQDNMHSGMLKALPEQIFRK